MAELMDAPKPEDVQHGLNWWAQVGAFVGGIATILVTRLGLRSREQRDELTTVADAIREDGEATRKILTAMRTDLAILLDRDDHRGRT